MNYYYCPKCNAVAVRKSNARKIKSICSTTGGSVFITLITNADDLANKMRSTVFKDSFELDELTLIEQMIFKKGFEQGVKALFNGLRQPID